MSRLPRDFAGRWRIVHMDEWDAESRDMLVPAYLILEADGLGYFQFCVVEGSIDARVERRGEQRVLEFSWEGGDDGEPTSGRGWAALEGERLAGRLYFHRGDDSGFLAVRDARAGPAPAGAQVRRASRQRQRSRRRSAGS